MVIITNKKTKPREQNDFYRTPYDLAYKICERFVDKHDVEFAIDPGMGDGVFGIALRDYVLGWNNDKSLVIDGIDIKQYDVDEHSTNGWSKYAYDNKYFEDYLAFKNPFKYDLVIGNPPYSLAEEFIRKSIEISSDTGLIVFLLKLAFLESKKRARGLFIEYPPTSVSVLAQRPSFYGNNKTNDYAFAVFAWDKMSNNTNTVVNWLDWR